MPGPKFPDSARPDERTVQKVAAGEVSSPPRRRRRRRAPPVDTRVTTTQVDPRVWEVANRLASSPQHIEVRSPEEVVVHNHPPPWPTSTEPPR